MSTIDTPISSPPLSPSCSVNVSTLLGKCHHRQAGQSPEPASKQIAAAMTFSTTTPDFSPGELRSTPVISPTHTSIPDTFLPSKWRPNISLNPIDTTSTGFTSVSESSSFSSSHYPKPASPATIEIIYFEESPEERMETLRAAGIKVCDFVTLHEPIPNSSKAR